MASTISRFTAVLQSCGRVHPAWRLPALRHLASSPEVVVPAAPARDLRPAPAPRAFRVGNASITETNVRRLLSLAASLVLATSLARPTGAQLAHAEPEWYLPTGDGCRLFVQEYGTGRDTVIVVHGGFGAEHSYLLDAFRGLEERFHFVFYDQRGSLRSPCPDSLISVAAHIRDVE